MKKSDLPYYISIILDRFGLYLVLPIFSPLILYSGQGLVTPETSLATRFLLIGLLLGIYPFMQFFFGPIYAQITETIRSKNQYLLGLVLCALTTVFTAYALQNLNLTLLIFARALSGIPSNLKRFVFQQVIATQSSQNQIALLEGIGFISAIFIGGYFSDPTHNIAFFPSLPLLILFGFYLLNLITILPEKLLDSSRHSQSKIHIFRSFKEISEPFEIPQIRALSYIYFSIILAWVTMLQFNSVYLIEKFHATEWEITITYLIMAFFWSYGSFLIARLNERTFYPQKIMVTGIFLSVLSFGLPVFSPNIYAYYASAGILAFFLAIAWSTAKKARFFSVAYGAQKYSKLNHAMKYLALGLGPLFISIIMQFQFSFLHIFSGLILFIALILFQKYYRDFR